MKKITCIFCRSSRVVKRGFRYNESGEKQLFLCSKCGRKFTPDNRRMRFPEKEIKYAVKLHVKGMSLSEVQREMKRRSFSVSRWTISLWTKKY